MAGRVTLVTLLLFFLVALLVHYLMSAKEAFANPPSTPLTKETLKQELDTVATELYSDYLKLTKEKNSNDMIKARITLYTELLNNLNDLYKNLDSFPIPSSVTVQDVQLAKQFILYTLSPVYVSSITTPATVNDLRLFMTRLQSTTTLLTSKIPLVLGSVQSGAVIQQINSNVSSIITNTNVLIQKLPMMKPEEIPVFKSDRYVATLGLAYMNYVITPAMLNGPTTPVIDALPVGTTPSGAISTLLQPTTIAAVTQQPSTTPSTTASTGFKFSELVKSLMSYDGIAAAQAKAQIQPSPPVNSTVLASLQQATKPQPTTTDMNNLKEFVSDEVDAKLAKYKLGPKDVQNMNVVNRKTNPVTTETPKASSNALEQGKWFRNENSEACPYATGQQATGFPQPNPIDMNDYVRKDSIPCWGCSLK